MRKELCRNFQQGRYGERCRYLHPQPVNKPNNPFGFGTPSRDQQQQNKSSNPFGFGVQGGANSNRPNQSQPFQNTWQRNPSTPGGGGGASSTQQSGKQTQQAEHKCTDPAACKRLIQEDLKNERPMWKLTCYAHSKHLPCDVSGDISYEELRAMAYEESKRGIPLQSIVERERNLQNTKLAEFENFLRSPYRGAVTPNQTPSIFSPASQVNSSPGGFSAFNQQPAAFPNTNAGGGVSSSGSPNPFGGFNQQPNAFSVNNPQPAPSGPSGFQSQPSSFGTGPVAPSGFQSQPVSFGTGPVAPSGFQSQQPSVVAFKPSSFGSGPGLATGPSGFQSQPVSFGPGPPKNNIFSSVTPNTNQNNQNGFNFSSPVASFTSPAVDATNTPSGIELQAGDPVDTSIWLKEKWNPGEIPEQAPPDAFVRR